MRTPSAHPRRLQDLQQQSPRAGLRRTPVRGPSILGLGLSVLPRSGDAATAAMMAADTSAPPPPPLGSSGGSGNWAGAAAGGSSSDRCSSPGSGSGVDVAMYESRLTTKFGSGLMRNPAREFTPRVWRP